MKKNIKKSQQQEKITRRIHVRIAIVFIFLFLLFMALVVRLVYLAHFESERLIKIQDSQIEVVREVLPPRGDILDRSGKLLAKDTPLVRVVIDPKLFHNDWCMFGSKKCDKSEEYKQKKVMSEKKTLQDVGSILGIDVKQIVTHILEKPNRRYKIIATEVPPDKVNKRSVIHSLAPYIYFDYYYRRFYPMKESASSLLGVVNLTGQGLSGVEKAFNGHLLSQPGKVMEKYSGEVGLKSKNGQVPQRRIFSSKAMTPPVKGQNLRLTIDSYLQHLSYKVLSQHTPVFGAEKSSAIIASVETGEILALADFPGTNTNDRKNLKYDYTVSSTFSETYEPGSSMKPLVLLHLLEKQLLRSNEVIDTSPGHIYIDKWLVKDAVNYKKLTPSQVIQKSSNVGMVKLASRIDGGEFSHFLNLLGLNESSGIFPGMESIGNIGNAWESEVTLLNQSYGYGLEVTLVAMVRAYVTLARSGDQIPLTLVAGAPQTESEQIYSKHTANKILSWMVKVTEAKGTGSKAALNGVVVAGKTGTARARGFQLDSNEVYNNMFVGIFPAESPKYIVLVGYRNISPPTILQATHQP